MQLSQSNELGQPVVLQIPSRWAIHSELSYDQTVQELRNLGRTLAEGCNALSGLYMRICTLIRQSTLTDEAVREALKGSFPHSRISEIIRVSRAPEDVWDRWRAGFFGFRAALQQTRYYGITPTPDLERRRIRRAATRLISLLSSPAVLYVRNVKIVLEKEPRPPRQVPAKFGQPANGCTDAQMTLAIL